MTKWTHRVKTALRSWFRRSQVEQELDEELAFHLEMQTRHNREQGLSPEEARRKAVQQLGGLEQVRQSVRETRSGSWLGSLVQDLRFALRVLRRQPGFTLVAVLTLAMGIGVNTAFFSVLHGVLLADLPYPDSERLVLVGNDYLVDGSPLTLIWMSVPEYLEYRDRSRQIAPMALWGPEELNVTVGTGSPELARGARVTPNFFSVMGVEPSRGRRLSDASGTPGGPEEIVLSHGLWQRRFGGDEQIVGRVLNIEDRVLEVVGVMPPGFDYPSRESDFWMPLVIDRANPASRGAKNRQIVARLAPGADISQARRELAAISAQLKQEYPEYYPESKGFQASVTSLKEHQVGEARPALMALAGAVALVLLIACANVANLLLARGSSRRPEMAIRTAMGAGRKRLMRQLLTETVLLSLLAGGAGLLAADLTLDALRWIGGSGLPRLQEAGLDLRFLALAVGLSLVTGIAAGLVPAWQVPRTDLNSVLKISGRRTASASSERARRWFVTAEMAIALILLAGAGLHMQSFSNLLAVDLGFRTQSVISGRVALSSSRYTDRASIMAFYEDLLGRLEAHPRTQEAGLSSHMPLDGSIESWSFGVEGYQPPAPDMNPAGQGRIVSSGFFSALGIPLLEGRLFDRRENPEGPYSVIVSESAARKYWPGQSPVGRRIKLWGLDANGPWRTVVGVVGDIRFAGAQEETVPFVYYPYTQQPRRSLTLVVRGQGDPQQLTALLRSQVEAIDPLQPLHAVHTLQEFYQDTLARPRFSLFLLGAFALLAVMLAVVGVCGLIAYFVAENRAEIGIRIALGASRRDILHLVLRQALRMTAAGIAIGLPASLLFGLWMRGILFGVSPVNPLPYIALAAVLLALAMAAALLPARRALRVDPLEYCR
ncbi:MAG TPA: ABC transporter permease [Acidobacteriota bacterium]|nr:ABC transporter permease [Acidobacteriota bacterium]